MPRLFVKGQSGNPKGRPAGALNKRTLEIREWAQKVLMQPAYTRQILKRAREGTLPPHLETLFYHYGFGIPKQPYEVSGQLEHHVALAPVVESLLGRLARLAEPDRATDVADEPPAGGVDRP